jgi:excinuclease ABC subunit C
VLSDEVIARIPAGAGVYLFKDASGAVVYVGKAKSLRARVRQYVRPGGDERLFVAAGFLAEVVTEVETMVVADEKEALLLENHLIKEHRPRFNVKLRDDKQYLVLRLAIPPRPLAAEVEDRRVQYPRVEVVRHVRDDGARHFGPYHSATGARETLRVLNRHFQLRTCSDHVLEHRGRVCLQYQIKRCPGPCALPVDLAAYRDQVDDVAMFLAGRDRELVERLRQRMFERSEREDFEGAARLRDSIAAVEKTLARQRVVQDELIDQDIWGLHRRGTVVDVAVLFVRAGKLLGQRGFLQRDQELGDAQVLSEHVQQYYASGALIPDEVVVALPLEDAEVLVDWLSSLRGAKVRVVAPQRGGRVRLVELALDNARATAERRDQGPEAADLLVKLQQQLGLRHLPRRIECFDIAHLQGQETVAAMVTFVDGEPARRDYRRFKLSAEQNNDFASMYEVLSRRFRRAQTDSRWPLPDLLVIDGGKGQLASAVAALTDLGVEVGAAGGMEVVALAKERELEQGTAPDRVFLRNVKDPIALRARSAELFVLARIRDEAHRFANTFHRQRRSKRLLRSELDEVPMIGSARKRALLRHFGSVDGMRAATVDELAQVPGMSRAAATVLAGALAAKNT